MTTSSGCKGLSHHDGRHVLAVPTAQPDAVSEGGRLRRAGSFLPGPDVPELERAGIPHQAVEISRKEFSPLQDMRSLWQLYRLFKAEKPSIVHTHTPKPGLVGRLATRFARVPVIINTIHGYHFHSGMPKWRYRLYVLIERFASRKTDLVLSQNHEDLDTAIEQKITPADRIAYLGNGIDLMTFDPKVVTRSGLRSELGIAEDAKIVGFVGRLKKGKGLLDLFQAASRLRSDLPEVHYLVIGETDEGKRDAVTAKDAADYGVADIFHFLGKRGDVPELLGAMDLFVLPSYIEGFPRSAMEASAMGVPVVATDIRGCREAVQDGDNGLLVPPGDSASLAAAMSKVLKDAGVAEKMGRAGNRDGSGYLRRAARVREGRVRLRARPHFEEPRTSGDGRRGSGVENRCLRRFS